VTEGARGGGQPRSAALRADRRRLEERGALDRERARPHRLARPADGGLGLARQVGLVQGERVSGHHLPVGDHLIAGRQAHEVSGHHPVDGHPTVDPIADDHRLGRHQRGEPVERAFGTDLLERPDRDVRDQDPEEERVLPGAERDRQHAEEEKDPVRDVQRVRSNDAGVRAARALARELPTRLRRSPASASVSPTAANSVAVAIPRRYPPRARAEVSAALGSGPEPQMDPLRSPAGATRSRWCPFTLSVAARQRDIDSPSASARTSCGICPRGLAGTLERRQVPLRVVPEEPSAASGLSPCSA
jgi:hypothetical protein